MKPEKMLKKLLNKSREVPEVDIPKENLIESPLEDFYNARGEIYYYEGILYRETARNSGEWFYFVVEKPEPQENQEGNGDLELKKRIESLEKWTWDLKKYVEDKLEEIAKEFKEYIDNKEK